MTRSCSTASPAARSPTGDLEIEHVLSDIESLNRAAFEGRYEISAVSFHAYAHLADRYLLLPHGASMGDNYGPIVVAREELPPSLDGVTVAIPGTLTTAFLALRIYRAGCRIHGRCRSIRSRKRSLTAACRPGC